MSKVFNIIHLLSINIFKLTVFLYLNFMHCQFRILYMKTKRFYSLQVKILWKIKIFADSLIAAHWWLTILPQEPEPWLNKSILYHLRKPATIYVIKFSLFDVQVRKISFCCLNNFICLTLFTAIAFL